MCTNRRWIKTGVWGDCGHCEQCRRTRFNDVSGRLFAEAKTCPGQIDTVTLTYGFDYRYHNAEVLKNPHAVGFFYEDVQGYLKRLRHNSDGCRFFVAGECGSEKGRVHWHMIVFWQGKPCPNIEYEKEYFMHWAETPEQAQARGVRGRWAKGKALWPHGFSYWQPVRRFGELQFGSIAYVAKYIMKDNVLNGVDMNGFKHRGLSSQPPIGSEYFRQLARLHVDSQLSPQDWRYRFPEVRYPDGKQRWFPLPRGASRDIYLGEFVEQWRLRYGNDKWPFSQPVQNYLDRLCGHFSKGYDHFEQDERFHLEGFEKPGRMLPLLRTKVEDGSRWRLSDIGNDMERFDDDGWPIDESETRAKARYRR